MRLYFTSDLHGSHKCWLKFLATPRYYQADVIIVGGDILGKFIVPLIQHDDGTLSATFLGVEHRLKKPEEVERLRTHIATTGQYAFATTPDEYARYKDNPERVEALFRQLALERLEHWVRLADERLSGQPIRCLVSCGNDDFFEADAILAQSRVIEVPEGRIVDVGDGFELCGVGHANLTPWECPRDVPEEVLAQKITDLARAITEMDRAIFDIHVPPYGSGLDEAPKLDHDLRVVLSPFGQPEMAPVGSTAVREAMLTYQPLLGLHGHIHESAGIRKLGRTTVINPGSEYGEGILRGALIDLDARQGLRQVQLVSG